MEFPGFDMMVDNWIRLGLVEIDYTHQVAGPGAYEWIQDRPEIKRLSQEGDGNLPLVYYRNGIIQRTSMGLEFAKSVGLLDCGEGKLSTH